VLESMICAESLARIFVCSLRDTEASRSATTSAPDLSRQFVRLAVRSTSR
jgi:hypothetical protein